MDTKFSNIHISQIAIQEADEILSHLDRQTEKLKNIQKKSKYSKKLLNKSKKITKKLYKKGGKYVILWFFVILLILISCAWIFLH